MLTGKLLISLCLFVIFNTISAVDEDSCEAGTDEENFQGTGYFGYWYKYAARDPNLQSLSCIQYYIWKREDNHTLSLIRLYTDNKDISTHMELINSHVNTKGNGKSIDGHEQEMIAANYDSWAIVFAYDKKRDQHLVWILTRSLNFSSECLKVVTDILRERDHEFSEDFAEYERIDHSNCPDDWSIAEIEEVDFKYDDDVKKVLKDAGLIK